MDECLSEDVLRYLSLQFSASPWSWLHAYWSSLILSNLVLRSFTDSSKAALSSLFNGIWIFLMIPALPRTTGKLKQQPHSGWKWLMGRTLRLSDRIEEQMLDIIDPIPRGVEPFSWMIIRDLFLHSLESTSRFKVLSGSDLLIGIPAIVAFDHATTCESPCTPTT